VGKKRYKQSSKTLKKAVWNRWCFWRHKLLCNQSSQCADGL